MPLLDVFLEARPPVDVDFRIAKDATLPALRVQVIDQGSVVDLTGGTVTFSMEDLAGTAKITGAAAVLDTAASGIIRYDWAAADVDTDGIFIAQFKVVVGSRFYLVPNNSAERLRILIGQVDAPGVPQLPSTILHAPSHIRAGNDIVDADRLVISYNPVTGYVPDATQAEAGDVDDLTAHLKGIADAISQPSVSNKFQTALLTATDGNQAVTAGIVATPAKDSFVEVQVNGQAQQVGDGVKTTDCYFSSDTGTTARLIKDITALDTLHWNGSVAGFQLAVSDRVSFLYNENV